MATRHSTIELLPLVSLARVELAPHMETRPSTLRVYLFHHGDLREVSRPSTFLEPESSKLLPSGIFLRRHLSRCRTAMVTHCWCARWESNPQALRAHGSEPCVYTIPPLTLVHPEGFEPSYPVRGAVLQTAAFNQTRPQMLETPVGIEPTITVLQTDALPLGDGVWHAW